MQPSADADLVCRCLDGDQTAFAELFERYKTFVYRTAYLMTGRASDAEDVLQKVFAQVFRALDSYNPERGSFGAWVHRVTVNQCLSLRRRRCRHFHEFSTLASSPSEPRPGVGDCDESAAETGSVADQDGVRHALEQISPKLRAVVILRYYWEFSYAEIANMLDVPLGTVKSRLNLAMRQLRKELEVGVQAGACGGSEVEG